MARGKTAIPLDLPRPPGLSGRCAQSKQDCIGDALRDAILRKLLPGGSLLPSTRTLAARWGVARGTVEAAFDRLCAEGYIARMRGSGTRVSAVVPDDYLASAQRPAKPASRPRGEPAAHVARKRAAEPDGSVRAGVPFVARLADPALLPMRTWKRHVCKGLSDATPAALCTLSPQGAEPLRARIADYLGQYRGIACSAADIFITTGIRHSIDLIARTIVGDDSRIALEEPGYRAARRIFELAGAESIGVPVDPEGIDTNALSAHRRVAAAYVTPAHQAPLGVTMSVSRRLDLLDWAYARHAWVIEDDYDGEFGYQSAPLPALKSLDVRDRVIYCGSFNKTLFRGCAWASWSRRRRCARRYRRSRTLPGARSARWSNSRSRASSAAAISRSICARAATRTCSAAMRCSSSSAGTPTAGTRFPASTPDFISCCGSDAGSTNARSSRRRRRPASCSSRCARSRRARRCPPASSSAIRR
ncbi:aminotransferase class I and II family protein [Burkholderia thailandensis]|uniref:Aminotransferase class I and II family protein n=1 Tax=Burkholderia thailandensis TaxID=57975 RepID=A0AAW9CMM6_BURTH|nr:aminotransferase class I and II family protein [Burkholderia thailandensis]